jgi:hypothetical protein
LRDRSGAGDCARDNDPVRPDVIPSTDDETPPEFRRHLPRWRYRERDNSSRTCRSFGGADSQIRFSRRREAREEKACHRVHRAVACGFFPGETFPDGGMIKAGYHEARKKSSLLHGRMAFCCNESIAGLPITWLGYSFWKCLGGWLKCSAQPEPPVYRVEPNLRCAGFGWPNTAPHPAFAIPITSISDLANFQSIDEFRPLVLPESRWHRMA